MKSVAVGVFMALLCLSTVPLGQNTLTCNTLSICLGSWSDGDPDARSATSSSTLTFSEFIS